MTSPTINHFTLPSSFTFTYPPQTPPTKAPHIAYLDINPTANKVALIPTCFKGRLLTTLTHSTGCLRSHRIIVVALFGNGESSSPSNTPTGEFPEKLDYRDCVRAQYELVQHLGVKELDVVLGFSMAGQCTYYWACMYPEFVRKAVVVCSSAKTSGHNFQFLEGPRTALEASADYRDYKAGQGNGDFSGGLRAFGKAYSAWLTSAEWFDEEGWKGWGFESQEAWDLAGTTKGYEGWHPDDLLVMLGMWQRGNVCAAVGGDTESVEEALGRVEAKVVVMPCKTDQYFRPDASEREVGWLGANGKLKVIDSIWGHVAGGGGNKKDTEWMDGVIGEFLGEA